MEGLTRISDLPEQGIMNSQQGSSMNYNQMAPMSQPTNISNNRGMTGEATNYVPINVHPNPYGISAQNPIMPPPQNPQQQQQNQFMTDSQIQQLQQMQNQRLPSRDIPHDTSERMHDEEVKPNYIPKVRFNDDYVRNHEDLTEKNLRDYEEKNKREKKLDLVLNEIQTPIFIAILFIFFQLPLVNIFFKRFSFLSIYNSDGNFNFNGLLLKSMMFGGLYYLVIKVIHLISEF